MVTRMYSHNENKIYIGTRGDGSAIVSSDNCPATARILAGVDLPFSFIADTLALPFDIYDLSQIPPSIDPLRDWTLVTVQPPSGKNKSASFAFPFNNKIATAVDEFIKKKNFRYGPQSAVVLNNPNLAGATQFYEDSTGRHAVRLSIPLDKDALYIATYILIFDQSDTLAKVIKYKTWHGSMCMIQKSRREPPRRCDLTARC